MAGISQKASPEEVLPLLAHEANMRGYVLGRPTKYLLLVRGYLRQARELAVMAGPEAVIHVSSCADAGPNQAVALGKICEDEAERVSSAWNMPVL